MNNTLIATDILKYDEGWRSRPYYCSENYPTIGYGFKIGDQDAPLPNFTLNRRVGDVWLQTELEIINLQVTNYFTDLEDGVRKAVLSCMAYQMGFKGLLGFKNTCRFVKQGRHSKASVEMLDSYWAKKQTPLRAIRYSKMYAKNQLLEEYK